MLRSMYSGISGMKNFQTKLDVIGNNIANVNTYGFKKERTVFKDLISQTQSGASGPSATRGGVNAIQVGLGSQLAAIDTIHTSGSMQSTGRTLDLGISGEGFFMVADSIEAPDETGVIQNPEFGPISYTRAGNFYMDKNGYLVNGDGKYLVGYANSEIGTYDALDPENPIPSNFDDEKALVDAGESLIDPTTGGLIDGTAAGAGGGTGTGTPTPGPIRVPVTAQSMSISKDGTISFVDSAGKLQYAGTLVLAKFANASGLEKTGSNYFLPTQNSGDAYVQLGTQDGIGSVNSGFVEMSNVDLSEEFTEMIVAQRGFQANSRIITTSDEILQELVNLKR
ncbi:flagellar hook-basal body complex protein [Solibacillus sp. FSL R7-0668]|uniref:flagellar hook-basal body complex protein n=1 Tax=Solibacillus sp. FSL R7-0668 TaxID=2921688 RepID=UPI0030FC44B4